MLRTCFSPSLRRPGMIYPPASSSSGPHIQRMQRSLHSSSAFRRAESSHADPRNELRLVENADVVIVGAGPSGLSAAIRLKQLAQKAGQELRVCLIEKGAEVGAHILSGAVIETRALDELLPDWRARGAPLRTEAREDRFVLLLGPRRSVRLPTPPQMRNKGNYIVSLGEVCRWLGKEAEAHGVEVYAGVAASELLMGARGEVQGVATGDLGLARDGKPKPTFQRGIELRARLTLLAEGARGSLTRVLDERLGLRAGAASSASYGLGVKELWEVPAERTSPGRVEHTIGWPLDAWTYGGSFIYHLERGLVAVGFVVGLDYRNPYLSPYREFQRFKTHPYVRGLLEGGRPLSYGARALYEGGIQALPRLTFPGGALIGDTAGFLNVPKIKGTHTAMKSGLLAAEAAFEALRSQPPERDGERPLEPRRYQELLRASWLWEELHRARNIRPYFAYGGLWGGLALSALDTYLLRGRAPWTLRMPEPDHKATLPLSDPRVRPISYPKPDGRLTFDLMTSVARSGTQHEEDQPPHLVLHDPTLPDRLNLPRFGGPEQYYCPAGVYEYVPDASKPTGQRLQINFTNCVHCKTCDIKDPGQNIRWTTPEGGGGPLYANM